MSHGPSTQRPSAPRGATHPIRAPSCADVWSARSSMDASSIAATDDQGATRRAIVEVCRRLYGAGLIAGQDGNVSVRRGNVILVTPSGISKVDVREADLVELALDGGTIPHASRASSE